MGLRLRFQALDLRVVGDGGGTMEMSRVWNFPEKDEHWGGGVVTLCETPRVFCWG